MLFPLVALACACTDQDRPVVPSGFLSQELEWHPDEKEDALYWYQNPDCERSRYQSIMTDPIRIWSRPEREFSEAATADLRRLTELVHRELLRALKKHFTTVFLPFRSTLRLQMAVTELQGSTPLQHAGSASGPHPEGAATREKLAPGARAFLDRAAIEYRLIDGLGGYTCLAGIDARRGGEAFSGASADWEDVQEALAGWADDLARRLKEALRVQS